VGGITTIDPSLFRLAEMRPQCRRPAYTIALMQRNISRDHGHIVAINDELVSKKILRSSKVGQIPTVQVRCLRCAAVASLNDWITLSVTPTIDKALLWDKVRMKFGSDAARFTQRCTGEGQASMVLDVLLSLAKEDL
jgi:hypothetical protein